MSGGCIVGAGIDLVENSRMRDMLERWGSRFTQRVFLPAERAYCDSKAAPANHYAGRFAVKEAVTKALGTGMTEEIGWLDIEVVRDPATGAPSVRLSPKACKVAERREVGDILVSLSHTHNYAMAQAILVHKAASRT